MVLPQDALTPCTGQAGTTPAPTTLERFTMNTASPTVRKSFDTPEDFLREMNSRSNRAQGGPPPGLEQLLGLLAPRRPPLWYRTWRGLVGIAGVITFGAFVGVGIKVGFVAYAYALTWF